MAAADPAAHVPEAEEGTVVLSAAERARIERNRQRARALRDARLVERPPSDQPPARTQAHKHPRAPVDTGGGFLLDPEDAEGGAAGAGGARLAAPPAPLQPPDQPECRECARRFPASFLLDNFDYNVCDDCRQPEGAHELLTRTEARTEFLLKECDLDLRPPPLRALRRPNPHKRARSDMRLYLRAQVEQRALEVWGSAEALEAEREARGDKRARTKQRQDARRLRALRMSVRSSLYTRGTAGHQHRWGPETCVDQDEDLYSRTCLDCGHDETYEKM